MLFKVQQFKKREKYREMGNVKLKFFFNIINKSDKAWQNNEHLNRFEVLLYLQV